MSKKTRKIIKYSLFALLFALLLASVSAVATLSFRAREEKPVPFSQKIVLNLKDKAQYGVSNEEMVDDSAINVMLQYAESFTCAHTQITTEKELEEHRAELRAHYTVHNADLVSELDFDDCVSTSYSYYGPFIEYRYASAEAFFSQDCEILRSKNSADLEKVYVETCDYTDDATRNSGRNNYPFEDALADIGVTEKKFLGDSVKVGIVESGVPNSTVNLQSGMYETHGTTLTAHSFQTSSIIGANSGIATNAKIYFAALSDYSFVNCCNWFIENGVNLINRSNGGGTGTYNSTSAYADYVVKETKITFINSAGNDGDTNLSGYPGTGVNVISVASTDWNGAISNYSSAGMQDGQTISLAKPTLAAPGGSISGIPNVGGAISGTSFSAPMVTGVVALLMDEFPQLKLHPEMVMALLTNTCTNAAGQTDLWDHDAGFGIINYERARAYFLNTFAYEVNGTATANSQIVRHYVTVPAYAELKATVSLMLNSKQKDQGTLLAVNYTKLRLAVMDNATGSIVASGDTLSNYSYLTYTNPTASNKSYSLCIFLASDKTTGETEQYAINYITNVDKTSRVSVGLYRNGQHVYGNNFGSSTTLDTGLTFEMGDVLYITALTDGEYVGCNYGLDNNITVTLNDFNVGENRVTFFGNGFQIELIITVVVHAQPLRLTVDGASYSNGATIRTSKDVYVSWSLSCDYGIATVSIAAPGGVNMSYNCKSVSGRTLSCTAGNTVTYLITLTDDYGNSGSFALTIDKDPPKAEIYKVSQSANQLVADGSRVRLPFFVSFDKADATAVYRLNGGSSVKYNGETLSADGSYEFTVTDKAGNATRRTVTLDRTAPTLNVRLSIFGMGSETQFSVTASSAANLEGYFLTGFTLGGLTDADDGATVKVERAGVSTTYAKGKLPVSFTQSGQYLLSVTDTLGNGYSFNLFVIGDEPEVAFTQAGDALGIRIAFGQEFEHATRIEIYKDGTLLNGVSNQRLEYTYTQDGTYLVIVEDNLNRHLERIFTFLKAAPAGELIGVENGGEAVRDVTLLYDASRFGVRVMLNGEEVINSEIGAKNLRFDGRYELTLYYLNDVNNFTVYTFKIDKSAPEITARATVYGSDEVIFFGSAQEILNADLRTFKSFEVTSLTDASEYPVLEVSVNGELRRYFGGGFLPLISDGGEYALRVYDDNGMGYSFTVKIAGRQPQINMAANSELTSLSVDIDFSQTFASAAELSVFRNGVKLDGVSASVLRYTFVEDGEYTVSVLDDAGRLTEKSLSFKKRAPQATVTGVKQGGKTKGTVNFTYDTSMFYAQVYLNGVLVSSDYPVNQPVAYSDDCAVDCEVADTGVITLDKDGAYEIRLLYISDPENYVVYNFAIDTTAPTIQLNGCAAGKKVSGNVRVTWQDDDVKSATYSLNGGAEKPFEKDDEFTADGLYVITLKDELDNSSEVTFGIDKTAPTVQLNGGTVGRTVRSSVRVFWQDDDVKSATYSVNGGTQVSFNKDSVFIADGLYTVTLKDELDNESVITFGIDKTAPVVSATAWVYGGESQMDLTVNQTNCGQVRALYCTRFEVFATCDSLGIYYIEMNHNGDITRFDLGEGLPVLDKAGVYNLFTTDGLGNCYTFVVNVIGAEPEVEFTAAEDMTSFSFKVDSERSDLIQGVFVLRDGEVVEEISDIEKDGEYTVIVREYFGRETFVSFSFAKPLPTGTLSGVEEGGITKAEVAFSFDEKFTVTVLKDGEPIAVENGELLFTEDGVYEVTLIYKSDDDCVRGFSFEIDTVPPQIQLGGVEIGGSCLDPVVISEIEDGATVELYKNGELVEFTLGEEITEAGEYEVRVTDAAGNVGVYGFVIEQPASSLPAYLFLGGVGALIIACAVAAVVVVIRKKHRD